MQLGIPITTISGGISAVSNVILYEEVKARPLFLVRDKLGFDHPGSAVPSSGNVVAVAARTANPISSVAS